jgi:hypothetical protein
MTDRNIRPEAAAEGQPARVEVAPRDSSVRRDGSVALSARVFDSVGRELMGVPVTWSARPQDVGMVDARGVFRALRDGEAAISAAAGPVIGTARVTISDLAPAAGQAPASAPPVTSVPAADRPPIPAAEPTKAPSPAPAAPIAGAGAANCICGHPIDPTFSLCPECGKPLICKNNHGVKPTWKRCPFCGDDLTPRPAAPPAVRECPQCHAPLEESFKLCPECGTEVG